MEPGQAEPKRKWPELMGKTFEEAEEVVKRERPDANVVRMEPGMPETRDFRQDRVRLFVDANGVIIREPVAM